MSCCGNQRSALRQGAFHPTGGDARYHVSSDIDFEYTGNGRLTVTGPLTGSVYHFTANSRRTRIHGPDVPSLVSVPGLKPVG